MKMTKLKIQNYSSAGFTLIELIVATGLFAVVALLSFAILSQAQRIEARTEAQRRLSEASRFVTETIARQTRLADGLVIQTIDYEEEQIAPSFRIFSGNVVAQPGLDELVTGDELQLATTNSTGPSHELTRFLVEEIDGQRTLIQRECESPSLTAEPICLSLEERHRLTPTDIEVSSIEFRGIPPTVHPDRQPFLEILITLSVLLPESPAGQITHEVRTLVSGRNYAS